MHRGITNAALTLARCPSTLHKDYQYFTCLWRHGVAPRWRRECGSLLWFTATIHDYRTSAGELSPEQSAPREVPYDTPCTTHLMCRIHERSTSCFDPPARRGVTGEVSRPGELAVRIVTRTQSNRQVAPHAPTAARGQEETQHQGHSQPHTRTRADRRQTTILPAHCQPEASRPRHAQAPHNHTRPLRESCGQLRCQRKRRSLGPGRRDPSRIHVSCRACWHR